VGMDDPEDFDAHLEVALIGGRERREIVVVAYDPRWVERFEGERDRISAALGDQVVAVHHVGSTAVPGLVAKPIIDIVLVVRNPDGESSYVPSLESAGYELRVREEDHRMLRTPAKDVHVHCWSSAEDVGRHLLFRDWLRNDESDRARYGRLKTVLAGRDWPDMNHYARAKSELVAEVMARAAAWERAGRPT
jgi:GrpB-like predicted nucleotidyltransferase (UPF0157 family)